MKLDLHVSLAFNGQCEAAFRFYERCLNGTITFMLTWGKSPMAAEAPPGWETKIYHSTLKIGDAVVIGGDFSSDRYEQPHGFSFVLQMDDPIAAEGVFQALSENQGRHAISGDVLGRPVRRLEGPIRNHLDHQL
jgi:PhnB protein